MILIRNNCFKAQYFVKLDLYTKIWYLIFNTLLTNKGRGKPC